MHTHRALLIAAIALAATLFSAASASAITISPSGSVTSSGNLTFTPSGLGIPISCNVTLGATVTAGTYAAGQTYGTVNRATVTGCSLGATVVVGGLPAPMIMAALNGTLQHKLVPITLLVTIPLTGAVCLWTGRLGADYDGRVLRIDSALLLILDVTQPLIRNCATIGNVAISGTLVLSPLITVTLP
jgi:hypothetical protein